MSVLDMLEDEDYYSEESDDDSFNSVDDEIVQIIRKKVEMDHDNFYNIFYLVKWASGHLSWEKDEDLGEYANLLPGLQKREDARSQSKADRIQQGREKMIANQPKKSLPENIVKPSFPKIKKNKTSHYYDKLKERQTPKNPPPSSTRPSTILQSGIRTNANNQWQNYVPPPVYVPPPPTPIILVNELANSLALLWSEYEYEEKKLTKDDEYVPTDIDFYDTGLSVVNTEKKSRVLTLTSIACHYVARNLKKYPTAVWLPLPLKARIFIYLVKYRFSLIEKNIKGYLSFLLDPYLSTLDLSMFSYRITNDIAEFVMSRCQHLTTLKLSGCSNITDEMFEKICRVCTKLRIVDTSGCPSIYSYSEILKGTISLISFSGSAFFSVHQFLVFIKVCSQLRVLHLHNLLFVVSLSNAENPSDLDVSATCTGLVSLKIHTAVQSRDHQIFAPFFVVNQFPNLEILDLKIKIGDARIEADLIESALKPVSAITHISLLAAPLRAYHFRDIARFSNLKNIKLERKDTSGGPLHLRDFNRFALEEIHFDRVVMRNPQEFLEFLLRPQSKYLRKLVLQNYCSFGQGGAAYQLQQEMLEFFINWKVAPMPQLTHLEIDTCTLLCDPVLVSRLFAPACTNLTTVILVSSSVGDNDLALLFKQNPKLEIVNLMKADRISDVAIRSLCANCPQLNQLNLNGCMYIHSGVLDAIEEYKPNLWKLHLACCGNLKSNINSFLYRCDDFLDHVYICSGCFTTDTPRYVKNMNLAITMHIEKDCYEADFGFDLFG